jgi:hypothetical protein
MSNTFDRDSYVEKVRKLLAKAEGASTSEEAEAFFGKASSLITEWEIEEAELADSRAAGEVSWKIEERSYPLSSYSPNQDSVAMQCVARAMGLRAYQVPYVRGCQKSTTQVFGTKQDLDRFEMMWASVSLQMTRFMKQGENSKWNRNQQRTFRLGFKVGFGSRIGERIEASRQRKTGKDNSKALVLVGKSEAIERALPENLRSRKIKTNAAAHAAGREAADRADINGSERLNAPTNRMAIDA